MSIIPQETSNATLLYTTEHVRAFYIQNGEESDLTPSGPQILSLLMVPTKTKTKSDNDTTSEWEADEEEEEEEDFYLHLRLPPELDLPLPATTQIFPQGNYSYLIPYSGANLSPPGVAHEQGGEEGAFIRVQFPSSASREDVDTFESILAQCTAFHERGRGVGVSSRPPQPPPRDAAHAYHYPDSKSDSKKQDSDGKIVLVDEKNGGVVGELAAGYNVVEEPGVHPGSKSKFIVVLWSSRKKKKKKKVNA